MTNETNTRNTRRTLQGTVVSTKMAQTIVVEVERTFRHPKYGKFLRKKKKYMAHDGKEEANMGDTVLLAATRPMSKRKRWRLVEVTERADLPELSDAEGEATKRITDDLTGKNDEGGDA